MMGGGRPQAKTLRDFYANPGTGMQRTQAENGSGLPKNPLGSGRARLIGSLRNALSVILFSAL